MIFSLFTNCVIDHWGKIGFISAHAYAVQYYIEKSRTIGKESQEMQFHQVNEVVFKN